MLSTDLLFTKRTPQDEPVGDDDCSPDYRRPGCLSNALRCKFRRRQLVQKNQAPHSEYFRLLAASKGGVFTISFLGEQVPTSSVIRKAHPNVSLDIARALAKMQDMLQQTSSQLTKLNTACRDYADRRKCANDDVMEYIKWRELLPDSEGNCNVCAHWGGSFPEVCSRVIGRELTTIEFEVVHRYEEIAQMVKAVCTNEYEEEAIENCTRAWIANICELFMRTGDAIKQKTSNVYNSKGSWKSYTDDVDTWSAIGKCVGVEKDIYCPEVLFGWILRFLVEYEAGWGNVSENMHLFEQFGLIDFKRIAVPCDAHHEQVLLRLMEQAALPGVKPGLIYLNNLGLWCKAICERGQQAVKESYVPFTTRCNRCKLWGTVCDVSAAGTNALLTSQDRLHRLEYQSFLCKIINDGYDFETDYMRGEVSNFVQVLPEAMRTFNVLRKDAAHISQCDLLCHTSLLSCAITGLYGILSGRNLVVEKQCYRVYVDEGNSPTTYWKYRFFGEYKHCIRAHTSEEGYSELDRIERWTRTICNKTAGTISGDLGDLTYEVWSATAGIVLQCDFGVLDIHSACSIAGEKRVTLHQIIHKWGGKWHELAYAALLAMYVLPLNIGDVTVSGSIDLCTIPEWQDLLKSEMM
ncbi:hypothetical protein K493DRAFT_341009 [Basidiobolus meristosporus CBS 931.73]|uniref:Uncharacterized protein n=1 Tax=Basidiobolus meristosporus CBS 931.73 TaxID=1314790 RepID=A0A1Y1XT19_9FUNG|nr:hypothetical protein K493DRAFT_341009 [Basidiobolus meristosporus CBS 931.73]|eukprot:ORX88907.1 hypothetical protein K493DRAFT_341009 [Basidiobolus meristosporus CBS 931.73]